MPQNKINYQKQLDGLLLQLEKEGKTPTLLLHSCCAPCSSYVLEYLSRHFQITVLYYNPNIEPFEEYRLRKGEQIRLIKEGNWKNPVTFLDCDWEAEKFLQISKGLEDVPEGGIRCHGCFALRLGKTAELAKEQGFDYFTTTLSISPLKNAEKLNEIGERFAKELGISHLPADFKKREGYKRSIELSRQYHLYRQDYCGCIFSKMEREKQLRTDAE